MEISISKMQRLKNYLADNRLNATVERLTMAEVVLAFDCGPFTIDDLGKCMKEKGVPVSRSTIYRNLEHLIASKLIKPIFSFHAKTLMYRVVSDINETHIVECARCGNCVPMQNRLSGELEFSLRQHYKFNQVNEISIMVGGSCMNCPEN